MDGDAVAWRRRILQSFRPILILKHHDGLEFLAGILRNLHLELFTLQQFVGANLVIHGEVAHLKFECAHGTRQVRIRPSIDFSLNSLDALLELLLLHLRQTSRLVALFLDLLSPGVQVCLTHTLVLASLLHGLHLAVDQR